jgi:hypothetical protein
MVDVHSFAGGERLVHKLSRFIGITESRVEHGMRGARRSG